MVFSADGSRRESTLEQGCLYFKCLLGSLSGLPTKLPQAFESLILLKRSHINIALSFHCLSDVELKVLQRPLRCVICLPDETTATL